MDVIITWTNRSTSANDFTPLELAVALGIIDGLKPSPDGIDGDRKSVQRVLMEPPGLPCFVWELEHKAPINAAVRHLFDIMEAKIASPPDDSIKGGPRTLETLLELFAVEYLPALMEIWQVSLSKGIGTPYDNVVLTFLDQNSPCGNQYFREHPNSRGILGCLIDAIAKFGFKDLTNLRPEDCLKDGFGADEEQSAIFVSPTAKRLVALLTCTLVTLKDTSFNYVLQAPDHPGSRVI